MANSNGGGVDGSITIEINADAQRFNQAVQQIQRAQIPDQTINIGANTQQYTNAVQQVNNTQLPGQTVQIGANTQGFTNAMNQVQNQAEDTSDKVKELFQKALDFLGTAAVLNGLRELVQGAVESYSSYEQLVGGIDTLFKEHSELVQEYAAQAYETVGVSANSYMEQVTSFSASLMQSLDGDTKKAAELSNQALIDMADNANKMGTEMSSIQHAYQGFAKQNYTMLDNLNKMGAFAA